MFLTSAILLAVVCTWIFGICGNASELHKPDGKKVYSSVTITRTHNINDVINEYCDYEYYRDEQDFIKEVCSINGMAYYKGKVIDAHSGDVLIMPHYVVE